MSQKEKESKDENPFYKAYPDGTVRINPETAKTYDSFSEVIEACPEIKTASGIYLPSTISVSTEDMTKMESLKAMRIYPVDNRNPMILESKANNNQFRNAAGQDVHISYNVDGVERDINPPSKKPEREIIVNNFTHGEFAAYAQKVLDSPELKKVFSSIDINNLVFLSNPENKNGRITEEENSIEARLARQFSDLDRRTNGAIGINKEDESRRSIIFTNEVISYRTVRGALDENAGENKYTKDSLVFRSPVNDKGEPVPQKIYNDALDPLKHDMDISKKFNLREGFSIEFSGETEIIAGHKSEAYIQDALKQYDKDQAAGRKVPDTCPVTEKTEAFRLLDQLSSLSHVKFDVINVPGYMLKGNENNISVEFTDKVKTVGDCMMKNSNVDTIFGGKNIEVIGKQALAFTDLDDKETFERTKDPAKYAAYTKKAALPLIKDKKDVVWHGSEGFHHLVNLETAAFAHSGLMLDDGNPINNMIRPGSNFKKLGAAAGMGTNVSGIANERPHEKMILGDYGFANARNLTSIHFGRTVKGDRHTDYPWGFAQGSGMGQPGFKKKTRPISSREGNDSVEIHRDDRVQSLAFAKANVQKLAVASKNIAAGAFVGCFHLKEVTFKKSLLYLVLAALAGVGMMSKKLYDLTLADSVNRKLEGRRLKNERYEWNKRYETTADPIDRDIYPGPNTKSKEGKETSEERTDTEKTPDNDIDETVYNDFDDVFFEKDIDDPVYIPHEEPEEPHDSREADVSPHDDTPDTEPETDRTEQDETHEEKEISEIDPDIDSPHEKFDEQENKESVPLKEMPEESSGRQIPFQPDEKFIEHQEKLGTPLNSPEVIEERRNQEVVTYKNGETIPLPTTLSESDKQELNDRISDAVNSLNTGNDDASHAFVEGYKDLGNGVVRITCDEKDEREFLKNIRPLVEHPESCTTLTDCMKNMSEKDILNVQNFSLRRELEKHLYTRDTLENEYGSNRIVNRAVKHQFVNSFAFQLAEDGGATKTMKDGHPSAILTKDGVKIEASYGKVRYSDKHYIKFTATKEIESGLSARQLEKKFPWISKNGKVNYGTTDERYDRILGECRKVMPMPFASPGQGSFGYKLSHNSKTDTYSVFVVASDNSTPVSKYTKAEDIVHLCRSKANMMISEGKRLGLGWKENEIFHKVRHNALVGDSKDTRRKDVRERSNEIKSRAKGGMEI